MNFYPELISFSPKPVLPAVFPIIVTASPSFQVITPKARVILGLSHALHPFCDEIPLSLIPDTPVIQHSSLTQPLPPWSKPPSSLHGLFWSPDWLPSFINLPPTHPPKPYALFAHSSQTDSF